eukprot:5279514-Amphidinium_carterae.1
MNSSTQAPHVDQNPMSNECFLAEKVPGQNIASLVVIFWAHVVYNGPSLAKHWANFGLFRAASPLFQVCAISWRIGDLENTRRSFTLCKGTGYRKAGFL